MAADTGRSLAVLELAQVAVRENAAALRALVGTGGVVARAAAGAAHAAVVGSAAVALVADGGACCARAGAPFQVVAI